MKKSILLFFALLISFALTQQTQAQTHSPEEIVNAGLSGRQYAFMTPHANFMQAALMNATRLKKENEDVSFELVLLGKILIDISKDKELYNLIEKTIKETGIRVTICESALGKLKLDKASFPTNVNFTPSAFIYYYGLQALGYNSIDL